MSVITKASLINLHQHIHLDSNSSIVIHILGGIDRILDDYLNNTNFILNQSQLKQLHNLLNNPHPIVHHQKHSEDNQQYTFDESNTIANRLFGLKIAKNISFILSHQITTIIVLLSGIAWFVWLITAIHGFIYPIFVLITASIIWIPYNILWLISANITGFHLVIASFEFWFKSVYLLVFLSILIIDIIYYRPNEFEYLKLFQYSYIPFAIAIVICSINIALFDVFKIRKLIKVLLSGVMATVMTACTLLAQFTTFYHNGHHSMVHISDDITISLTSLLLSSSRIIAIFWWKQTVLTILRNEKAVLIKSTPSIEWITTNETELETTEKKTNTPSTNAVPIMIMTNAVRDDDIKQYSDDINTISVTVGHQSDADSIT